ncbi:MAG: LD-carboxypeptidase [Flavobacteriales bacterium]|nr:LD-carboxypeptidase [Flavobacteriales bacterium]
MQSIVPPYLKPGDTIAIVATARWLTHQQLQPALNILHLWGFKTKIGNHVFTPHFQLAGTDDERTADFQTALDDPAVKAILIARGGYGTVRIIDGIDFSGFLKNPKWICGYSDVTVLHSLLNAQGIATIHSTMPYSFPKATAAALETLRLALTGELNEVTWSVKILNSEVPVPTKPEPIPLIGGNLSLLYSTLGSNRQPDTFREPTEPCILFLEDVDEMLYHIDRMMMALKRASVLERVQTIIVGGLTQMRDNTTAFGFPDENPWGFSANETVQRLGDMLQIPVLSGFPAGHLDDNRAFYLGRNVSLKLNDNVANITFAD